MVRGRPLSRVVFEANGVAYLWRDVLDAARASGDWEPLERRARQQAARLRAAEAEGNGPSAELVKARASEFRHARNLLAAEDMEAWLAHWGLTATDWMDHIRASALGASPSPSVDSRGPTPVWADAVCSGDLERLAVGLSQHLAVTAAAGVDPPGTPLDAASVGAMQATFDRFCAKATDLPAIDHEVGSHFLGWTRLTWRWVTCAFEAPAREAALCVREDRVDLEEVAGRAGLELHESSQLLDEVPPPVASVLTGAQPGEVLGPLRVADEFWVIEVVARLTPSVGDPLLRGLAARLVVARAVAREVSSRVTWRERA